ncbi:hypothetical protein EYF80_048910 [Liparis tanakae]|uniref:Uncharacterized protein n=1 Tax=Liparis tanakae TaxID=230148 RepID=A0A4Z2FI79_9TELE|nr:hypothetical protein EYF80_048910 [Liparis tanakae]
MRLRGCPAQTNSCALLGHTSTSLGGRRLRDVPSRASTHPSDAAFPRGAVPGSRIPEARHSMTRRRASPAPRGLLQRSNTRTRAATHPSLERLPDGVSVAHVSQYPEDDNAGLEPVHSSLREMERSRGEKGKRYEKAYMLKFIYCKKN